MAKVNEQKITFKLSELIRDEDPAKPVLSDDNLAVLIEALAEMVGNGVMIELE